MRILVIAFLLPIFALPLAAQTPQTKILVPGKVVGPDGAAVAGAQVLLEDGTLLRSDSAGRFTARATPRAELGGYLGRVIARAPGLGLGGALLDKSGVTIRLPRVCTARGRVVDEKGAPVAGADVQLVIVEPVTRSGNYVWLQDTRWQADFRARSDAGGSWNLPGVPGTGKIGVDLIDPRFARTRTSLSIISDIAAAPDIVAMPGSALSGRVIYEDGRAAPGFAVSAQGQDSNRGWAESKSGADGTFTLSSLAVGSYNVMILDAKRQWVAKAIEGALAQPGQTKTLPDLVLSRGVILTGRVLDNASGAGVANVQIGSYSAQNPRSTSACVPANTDARGHFQLRVPSGATYVYLMGPPSGYIRESLDQTVQASSEAQREIVFRLRRGIVQRGVAVDEKGKAVPGAVLLFTSAAMLARGHYFESPQAKTDARGAFELRGVQAGRVKLSADDAWQVVRPTTIELTGAPALPVRVVLRARVFALRALRGTVVTPDGTPLSGATITLGRMRKFASGFGKSSVETLLSNGEGRFSRSAIRSDETVTLSIAKPSYRFVSGASLTAKNNELIAAPAVLAPLTANLRGQITNANGAPAAQAWIVALEGDGKIVRADAQGRFVLENLPAGPLTLIAAQERRVARLNWMPGGEANLKLAAMPAPTQDIERAALILEGIARDPRSKNYYARQALPGELAPFDANRALQLARLLESKLNDETVAAVYASALETQPARAGEYAPLLLAVKPSYVKYYALFSALPALEAAQPGAARRLFEEAKTWLAAKGKEKLEGDTRVEWIFGHALVAALAQRSGSNETPLWVEKSLTLAKALESSPDDERAHQGMVGAIAEGWAVWAPALVEKSLDKLSVAAQAESLGRAIVEIAPRDLPLAQHLLERLGALPAVGVEQRGNSLNRDPEWAFGLAAKSVIGAMGRADAGGALKLARAVKSRYHRGEALATAAQFQPKAQAIPLLREAADLAGNEGEAVGFLARLGAMAYDFDAPLAREFWERALTILRQPERDLRGGLSDVAFYMARDDAARSRLLLESAFARGRASGSPSMRLVMAMCAVDVDRAVEMAEQIPFTKDDGGAHFEAQRKIAQYLLTTNDVRHTFRFDRWGATDTWRPGTPTDW